VNVKNGALNTVQLKIIHLLNLCCIC